jgi:hypothetical protein
MVLQFPNFIHLNVHLFFNDLLTHNLSTVYTLVLILGFLLQYVDFLSSPSLLLCISLQHCLKYTGIEMCVCTPFSQAFSSFQVFLCYCCSISMYTLNQLVYLQENQQSKKRCVGICIGITLNWCFRENFWLYEFISVIFWCIVISLCVVEVFREYVKTYSKGYMCISY